MMPDDITRGSFDDTGLQDDPDHWDARAQIVAAAAFRANAGSGLDWLAQPRTAWLAATFLITAALLSILVPASGSAAARRGADWKEALAPADDVGRAIILGDDPPPVGQLLLGKPGGP